MTTSDTPDPPVTEVYDLRVVVERIEGRSVCGMDERLIIRIERTGLRMIPTEDLT